MHVHVHCMQATNQVSNLSNRHNYNHFGSQDCMYIVCMYMYIQYGSTGYIGMVVVV